MNYLQRKCPSCGMESGTNVMSSSMKAELLTFDQIKAYWSGFFKEKSFFSYARCVCGLLYCPSFFTETQLQSLYKSMSDNTAGVPLSALKKTQKSYFDVFKKNSDLSGHYLEFGPDIGLFTEHCLNQGNFSHYWLNEPNQEVWETLGKKLSGKAHHIFSDMQEMDKIPDRSVSALVMIHVLDHLLDPVGTLEKIKTKLAPGASLLMVTHDEQSLLAKMTKSKWPPYCLQHPQLFNGESITAFLQKMGFNRVTYQKSYNYFPVTYLMKHMLFLLGIKKVWLPRLDQFQLGLKLGNMITTAKFV